MEVPVMDKATDLDMDTRKDCDALAALEQNQGYGVPLSLGQGRRSLGSHSSDEDLSPGTPDFHPSDEDLSPGTPEMREAVSGYTDPGFAVAARREIPTKSECEALLAGRKVETHIVLHSRKVAEIANRMAAALLRSGVELNPELVQAGALLHDLAKGQPDHAAAGASILRGMGFNRVAEIVAAHTDLGGYDRLDEAAIVYLADKLVRGEERVTLIERFEPALMRFREDALALEGARRRLAVAKAVAVAIENHTGVPLERLLHDDHGCEEWAARNVTGA